LVLTTGGPACGRLSDAGVPGARGSETTQLVLRIADGQTRPGRHDVGKGFQASISKFQRACTQSIPDTEAVATAGSLELIDEMDLLDAGKSAQPTTMMGWLDLSFPRGHLSGFITAGTCPAASQLLTGCSP